MDVKNIIRIDQSKIYYNKPSFIKKIKYLFTKDCTYLRWKYIKYMRLCDNLCYSENVFNNFKKIYFQRKKNKYGLKLGYEINCKNIKAGLLLYHNGPIVINGNSIIGENCPLHGDNCIGNNGIDDKCPIIGDNVEIGVGAKIIGNISIASNVKIGAGAVVVNSIKTEGCTVVGIPAKIVKKKKKNE